MILSIFLLFISIIFLWLGANYLVESAEKIAVKFGVSELVIGLTIVAFGTSAPELAVTVNAALFEKSSISVGNIVGSNIFNLGFILGAVALISVVFTSKKIVYRDGLFMFLTSLLLLFFFQNGKLERYEGFIMIGLLISYLIYLFIMKEPIEDDEIATNPATLKDYFILPISLAVIILGGNLLVSSASDIALKLGMREWLIAITVVAAGTSAPEMVTSIVAVVKGKHGMSAGNLIGSNIFNILGVLGTASILKPLAISSEAFRSLSFLCGMIVIVILFMRTKWKITKLEGAFLILIGLLLWIHDFMNFVPA